MTGFVRVSGEIADGPGTWQPYCFTYIWLLGLTVQGPAPARTIHGTSKDVRAYLQGLEEGADIRATEIRLGDRLRPALILYDKVSKDQDKEIDTSYRGVPGCGSVLVAVVVLVAASAAVFAFIR